MNHGLFVFGFQLFPELATTTVFGRYTCVAYNSAGETTAVIHLLEGSKFHVWLLALLGMTPPRGGDVCVCVCVLFSCLLGEVVSLCSAGGCC